MNNNSIYCYHCFSVIENPDSPLCPKCGNPYNVHYAQSNELPAGTLLNNGRYLVGKSIGSGGFGISYIGFDKKLNKRVLIKETFYSGLFHRNILDKTNPEPLKVAYRSDISLEEIMNKTEKECRHLSEGEGLENIVKVYDFFSENNTAYMITEFIEGINLYDRVMSEGRYTWDELYEKITPLMQCLEHLHSRHILHRDIKPQNIMIRKSLKGGEQFVLIDFGLARSISAKTFASVGMAFSPGYSPFEQRAFLKKDGTYTDVYSLAATIYFALTGENPNEELGETLEDNFPKITVLSSEYGVPENAANALKSALALDYNHRTDSIDSLLKSFTTPTADKTKSNTKTKKESKDQPSAAPQNQENYVTVLADNKSTSSTDIEYVNISKRKKMSIPAYAGIIAGSAVLLIAVFFGLVIFSNSNYKNSNPAAEELVSSKAVDSKAASAQATSNVSKTVESKIEKLSLPSLIGKDVGEATDLLDELNLTYSIEEQYNDSVDKGKVISQSPGDDTDIDTDSKISLKVSKGKKPVESKSAASEKKSEKTVSSQPEEVISASQNTTQQPESNKVIVPNLVGQDSNTAMSTLTSLDLYYTGNYEYNRDQVKSMYS